MSSDTRSLLLETAWKLLRRNPSAAAMGQIAAAAGVSRQTIYLHFQSRAGLLLALVRWVDERERIAEEFAAAAKLSSPLESLEAHVRIWLDYMPRLHPVPSFLARYDADSEAKAAWDDRMAELEKLYRRPLRILHKNGDLAENMSVERAVALVRAVASVHAWYFLVHDCGWKQLDAVTGILHALRGALLRQR
jgi:AcrR family transcriptional regulator